MKKDEENDEVIKDNSNDLEKDAESVIKDEGSNNDLNGEVIHENKDEADKEIVEKEEFDSKELNTVTQDEQGEPETKGKTSKKKSIAIILIVIILLVLIIAGSIVFFIINPNNTVNPITELQIKSAINDYCIYYNNEDWGNFASKVDLEGYYAFYAIYCDSSLADSEDRILSFSNFEDVYNDLEGTYTTLDEAYPDYGLLDTYYMLVESAEYGESNLNDSFELWEEMTSMSDLKIEKVENISKVEGTDSLFLVTVLYSYVDASGGYTTSNTNDIYVLRVDGEYKMVGGFVKGSITDDIASIVFESYFDKYYYDVYYGYLETEEEVDETDETEEEETSETDDVLDEE